MRTYFYIVLYGVLAGLSGCQPESVDPNAASEEEVLSTREGLISASIGLRAYYAKNSLLWVIENNALVSGEVSVTSSFQTVRELEEGTTLTPFNTNVGNLWASLLKVRAMAESISNHVDQLATVEEDKRLMQANALLYQALATGWLCQFFTHLPQNDQPDTRFAGREEGLQRSVVLLSQALELVESGYTQGLSDRICGPDFDLENVIRIHLSRYHLYLRNHEAALEVLEEMDEESVSWFHFSESTPNPIYNRVFGSNRYYQPIDGLGIPIAIEEDDQRLALHFDSSTELSVGGKPIETLRSFFDQAGASVPVYLPGEVKLIRAEAFLATNRSDDAVDMINHIRVKTDDPLGVNAGLAPYAGSLDADSITEELYRQRCLELFMTGLRLEDSRRLMRPGPVAGGQSERSVNFLPFPNAERINNPNTPPDPTD